jgi:hypothetical protein
LSPACPCGGRNAIRHATEPSKPLRLDGTRVVRVPSVSTRFLCRSCGGTFLVKDPVAVSGEIAAREHIAERVFAMGRDGAAREADTSHSTVKRLMRDWCHIREPGVEDADPDFLVVDVIAARGDGRVLLVDADGETLVEVLETVSDLSGWLERPGRLQPLRVCVPVDAGVAAAVRKSSPDSTLMVAPSTAWRAIRSTLGAGLGALRRDPSMHRRNGFPGVAGFLRALDGRVAPGEGWPREVLALLTAGRAARGVVSARDAATGRRMWPEMEVAAAVKGGSPLLRLLSVWREAILAGLDNRFVDKVCATMARVGRLVRGRRPALGFPDFRALVLLRDYRQPGPANAGGTTAPGRPLVGLLDVLTMTKAIPN